VPAWHRPDISAHRKRVAYHEAGHAVIGHVLKLTIESATIHPKGNSLGHVRHDPPREGWTQNFTNLILYTMAGAVSESELSGQPIDWKDHQYSGDRRGIRWAKNRLFYNDAEELSNPEYEEQTRQLVRRHWSEITTVASASEPHSSPVASAQTRLMPYCFEQWWVYLGEIPPNRIDGKSARRVRALPA
jgi:Peptidase family M41